MKGQLGEWGSSGSMTQLTTE